jgi:hypothetical protein
VSYIDRVQWIIRRMGRIRICLFLFLFSCLLLQSYSINIVQKLIVKLISRKYGSMTRMCSFVLDINIIVLTNVTYLFLEDP